MSALAAMSCIIPEATAVAEPDLSAGQPLDGLPFYRKHTLKLLRRYLLISMHIGRSPSIFGKLVFRGHVSSYRLRTFEDALIFVHDVEKAINKLDPVARMMVNYIALEDYTLDETVILTRHSRRNIARIYGEAMDLLTSFLLEFGLLDPDVETCQEGVEGIESNDQT